MKRFLLIICILTFCRNFVAVEISYEENHPNGPNHWIEMSKSCGGTQQSPINLDYHEASYLTMPPLKFNNFDKVPELINILNSGFNVQYTMKFSSNTNVNISGGPLKNTYILDSFHLHWGEADTSGTEHQMEGQRFAAELHVVTHNSKYESLESARLKPDGVAVIAFIFMRSSNGNLIKEDKFLRYLDKVKEPHSSYEIKDSNVFSLDDVVKRNRYCYFTYKGSLTTPGCEEVVTWMVMRNTLLISSDKLKELRQLRNYEEKLMFRNYRPIQEINNRFVLRNC